MNKLKKKVTIGLYAILSCVLCMCSSCIYTIYKYIKYEEQTASNLPDTFREELPLMIDSDADRFCLPVKINNQPDELYWIDTKAVSLMKEDELIRQNAHYWGKWPFSSENAYGQKHKVNLYHFDNTAIQSLSLGSPMFESVSRDNYLYKILDRSLVGTNILELLCWKFDLDNKTIVVFSKRDTALIKKETQGYTKIENGLRYNKINIKIPEENFSANFTMDLGYNGELTVNKKSFALLSQKFHYKQILTSNIDTVTIYLFEDINIYMNNIEIPHCRIIYNPSINRNLIGTQLMQQFNFVLSYGERIKHTPQEHLFVKPVVNYKEIKKQQFISDFGFNIEREGSHVYISSIELNGPADREGIALRDKVININGGDFDIYQNQGNNGLIKYLSEMKEILMQIERSEQISTILLREK